MKTRIVVVTMIAAVTLTLFGVNSFTTPQASAENVDGTTSVEYVTAAFVDVTPTVQWHWWGYDVYFSKEQTHLALEAYATVVGAAVPEFRFAGRAINLRALFATLGYNMAKEFTSESIDAGNCLHLRNFFPDVASYIPSVYDCNPPGTINGTVAKPA